MAGLASPTVTMADKELPIALYGSGAMFIGAIICNVLAFTGVAPFRSASLDILYQVRTILVPINWALVISSIIATWLGLSLVYLIANILRKRHNDPALFTAPLCYTFILSLSLQILWLFLWSSYNVVGASMFMFFNAILNWLVFGFFTKRLYRSKWDLSDGDLWVYRLLVQNALAAHATWTTLCSLANLSIAMQYEQISLEGPGVDSDAFSLSLLCGFLLLWIPLENYCYFEELHYVFTPYAVVTGALTGVVFQVDSMQLKQGEGAMAVILLTFVALVLAIRITLITYAHFKGHPFRKTTLSMLQITELEY